jgi:purine-cytosine permease-like protein
MKKHWKVILIWTGGISLGITISYFMGLAVLAVMGTNKVSYTLDVGNNWWLAGAIFFLMAVLIVAGGFLGRKIDGKVR